MCMYIYVSRPGNKYLHETNVRISNASINAFEYKFRLKWNSLKSVIIVSALATDLMANNNS